MRELRKIQDSVRGELDMVLHPEHGTNRMTSDELGDHADAEDDFLGPPDSFI